MTNTIRIVIAIVAVTAVAGGAYYFVSCQEVQVKVETPPPQPAQGMSEDEKVKAALKGIGSIRDLPAVTVPSGPPKGAEKK